MQGKAFGSKDFLKNDSIKINVHGIQTNFTHFEKKLHAL